MADEEILLDSDLEAVEPVQPKGRNWLKLLSVALVVAAVGVLSVAALPKAVAPLSRDTVELFGYSMTDDARAKYDQIRQQWFSYVIYGVEGKRIETYEVGDPSGNSKEESDRVKELVDLLPADGPRLVLLRVNSKLILINWSPEGASARAGLEYGSARHSILAYGKAIGVQMIAHGKSDLTMEKLRKKTTWPYH